MGTRKLIHAASFVRFNSEEAGYRRNLSYRSKCGNRFELRLVREINSGSVMLYEFYINDKKIDTRNTGYGLLPRAEFPSYRSRWYAITDDEMEAIVGFIA